MEFVDKYFQDPITYQPIKGLIQVRRLSVKAFWQSVKINNYNFQVKSPTNVHTPCASMQRVGET